jgi:hypothetical protein
LNYVGKIKAREETVNILINGGKKYNKTKRKTRKPKRIKPRKKKARRNQRGHNTPSPTNTQQYNPQPDTYRRNVFEQGHTTEIPMVVFGDGVKNRDHVHFRRHKHGVVSKEMRKTSSEF